jgi:hypothetical protein
MEHFYMDLKSYFEETQGLGILATADSDGIVDLALYAKPEVVYETTIAFVMRERLSHENLKSNPHAAYMFIEQGPGYVGKRLYLTKIMEETNTDLVNELIRKQPVISPPEDDSNKYLVFFRVDNIWPLVGDKI